jgi:hypothetical protein
MLFRFLVVAAAFFVLLGAADGCSAFGNADAGPDASTGTHADAGASIDSGAEIASCGKIDTTTSNDGGAGTDSGCSWCAESCGQGLVTVGAFLDPPGCGSQCTTFFCPGGCSSDCVTCLATEPADGGLGSCVASQLIATQGVLSLAADGGVAIEYGSKVFLATSADLACQSTVDAGIAPPGGSAAVVELTFPANFAGTLHIDPYLGLGAQLTTWRNGTVSRSPATSGALVLFLQQPGGGVIGTYSLTFGTDSEQGSFTAPACDVCTTPP